VKVTPPRQEKRAVVSDLEIRAAGDGAATTVFGYAAVFDSPSEVLADWFTGAFREIVDPGAFTKTLAETPDVRALVDHNPSLILGRTSAGTLRLSEDDAGLAVEIDLPDTTLARDLVVSMRRGDVTQMSFAFRTIKDTWGEAADGMPVRHLAEVALRDGDVSVVTYPAYQATTADVRSLVTRLSDLTAEVVHRRTLASDELADPEAARAFRADLSTLASLVPEVEPSPPLGLRRRTIELLELSS